MQIKPVRPALAAALVTLLAVSACGGGGGAAQATSSSTDPLTTPPTSTATLVPGATMLWATASDQSLSLMVQAHDGQPAAGAAVRVFTLSRTSPQDGAALEEPVPMSLLDTVTTDSAGRASLTLQWPGHVDELLVVATLQDTQVQTVVPALGRAGLVLRLAR